MINFLKSSNLVTNRLYMWYLLLEDLSFLSSLVIQILPSVTRFILSINHNQHLLGCSGQYYMAVRNKMN